MDSGIDAVARLRRATELTEAAGLLPCKTCGHPAVALAHPTPELEWPVCAAHWIAALIAGWKPDTPDGNPPWPALAQRHEEAGANV